MALFQKAVRRQVKLRVALIGPSGSGKTYSALLLCKGMGGRTALLDTEKGRGLHYADEKEGPLAGFEYDYLRLDPPYTPEAFIKLIDAAELEGIENLVIDSITHEWKGKGGCLDIVNAMPGLNSFVKWGKVTPRHNAFIDAITTAGMNIICTIRGKEEYVLETNDKGKQAPRKVGMGAEQRDGFEFECEIAFMLNQSHVADATKDNTHLFDQRYEVLSENDGRKIKEWALQRS